MIEDYSLGIIPFLKEKNDYKFLIVRQIFGDWIFPKGHTVGNETEIETVLRELFEETNITKCKVLENFREFINYSFNKNGNSFEKRVLFFLGEVDRVDSKKISSQNSKGEIIDLCWLSYEDVLNRLSHKTHRTLLKKALKYLKTYRYHR